MMKNRDKFANIGGMFHLVGNLCLAGKGGLDAWMASEPLTVAPFFNNINVAFSGMIFILGAIILTGFGHKNNAYAFAHFLGAVGYGILGIEILNQGYDFMTLVGIVIGFLVSFYIMLQSFKREAKVGLMISLLLIPGNYLSRKLQYLRSNKANPKISVRNYPFLYSGMIDFISDFHVAIGALRSGDFVLAMIGLFWGAGTFLLMTALPQIKRD